MVENVGLHFGGGEVLWDESHRWVPRDPVVLLLMGVVVVVSSEGPTPTPDVYTRSTDEIGLCSLCPGAQTSGTQSCMSKVFRACSVPLFPVFIGRWGTGTGVVNLERRIGALVGVVERHSET